MRDKELEIMPVIDKALRDIISGSLSIIDYDFSTFDPDCKDDEMQGVLAALTAPAYKIFNEKMQEACAGSSEVKSFYTIKDINSAKFVQKLLPLYTDNKELIRSFDRCNDRLKGILKSRENSICITMPKRILENLERYKKNIKIIEKLVNSEISKDIYDLYPKIDLFLDINHYKEFLTPAGIDEYNNVINGIVTENGIEKKGLVTLVSESNTSNKTRLPKPDELYKQVLFPKTKAFTIIPLDNDKDALQLISDVADVAIEAGNEIFKNFDHVDEDGLVVKFNHLGELSFKFFDDWSIVPALVRDNRMHDLKEELEQAATAKARNTILRKMETREKEIKKEQFSLSYIFDLCRKDQDNIENTSICSIQNIRLTVQDLYLKAKNITEDIKKDIASGVISKLKGTDTEKLRVKEMFDTWVDYRDFVLLFIRSDIDLGDNEYYNNFLEHLPGLTYMTKAETKILGYVTKKPGDIARNEISLSRHPRRTEVKWLQAGEGKESKLCINTCALYIRNGKYYYIQATPGLKPTNIFGNGEGEIATTKKFGNPVTQFPKIAFPNKAREEFEKEDTKEFVLTENMEKPVVLTRKIYEIFRNGAYTTKALKKGKITQEEYEKNLHTILSYYKEVFNSYENTAKYRNKIEFKPIEEYKNSSDFFNDVSKGAVYTENIKANDELIDKLVDEGKVYMFLLKSKGFTYKRTANEDILIEALENDLSDILICTNPKLFWRAPVIERRITHKKGEVLVGKRDLDGFQIPDDVYMELKGYYNNRSTKTELSVKAKEYINNNKINIKKNDRDIIKDERYTRNQQLIRLAYTKNASCGKAAESASSIINKIKDGMNILAVTRSMNDLLYVVVATSKGEVLESMSLNYINKTDWYQKLRDISEDRKDSKSDRWDYSKTCMNERDAYLSNAVSIIVRMAMKYNAIIVCEKISDEMKSKKSGADNQVFQKFEQALINRLADLHFRDIPLGQPGSVTNPYQLCDNNGNEFQDGIVFFVTNSYTFGVDLDTGFANIFELKNINTRYDKQNFLSKFDSIKYDKDRNRFVFEFDYDKFATKKIIKQTKWTILAGGPETRFNRQYKSSSYIEETATEMYKKLEGRGHGDKDLAKLALNAELSADEVNSLYNMFLKAVRGSVAAHDNVRKLYCSPITGKTYDYAEHSTLALIEKYKWTQLDKDERGEWIDNIKRR